MAPALREALWGDLWDLFRVDAEGVYSGDLDVGRFQVLVNRLSYDPRSHLRAHLAGGPEHWSQWLGWGIDQDLAANTIDAVHLNTYVAAKVGGSKRAKPFPAHFRPTPVGEAARGGLGAMAAPSIAAFPAAALADMAAAASDLPVAAAADAPPAAPATT